MSAGEYSEKDVEYVIKSFKIYLKKVVKHLAIDFVRKINRNAVKEITFTDIVDKNVSLSSYDSDSFLAFEEKELEEIISNSKLKLAIHRLSEDEKKILALSIQEYGNKEIARKLKLTEKTIKNKKSIIKLKIKNILGE